MTKTQQYSEGTYAKWYYNTFNNITDGEKEYTVHRKEPVKYLDGTILHGTNDLIQRLNDYEKENEELKQQNEFYKKRLDCIIDSMQNDLE